MRSYFIGFAICLFASFFVASDNVAAAGTTFSINNVVVNEKSATTDGGVVDFDSSNIGSNVEFHQLHDFISYNISVVNNTDDTIRIESVADDNTSHFLSYSYDFNKNVELHKNDETIIRLTVRYDNELNDVDARVNSDIVNVRIAYLNLTTGESGEDGISINPKTSDDIIFFVAAGLFAICMLIVTFVLYKKNDKKMIVPMLAVMFVVATGNFVRALDNYSNFTIRNKTSLMDKLIVTIGEGDAVDRKIVAYGEKIADLVAPEKDGHSFKKWTYDNGDDFDVETPIVADISIKPVYQINTFLVSFDTNGGSSVDSKYVDYGGKVTEPSSPTKSNFKFDGWYTTGALTTKYDFENNIITNETIIYAGWRTLCSDFSTASWTTIVDNISSDSTYYAVGCEKEVELDIDDNGQPESYTVRLANTTTDEKCLTEGFSQSACGHVIEFVDIIGNRQMNPTSSNAGGFANSAMRTYLNGEFYSKLPSDLKSVIVSTGPIISSSSCNSPFPDFTEKIYLLSKREAMGTYSDGSYSKDAYQRVLDYYALNSGQSARRVKKSLDGSANSWWLRDLYPHCMNSVSQTRNFQTITANGGDGNGYGAAADTSTIGVAPVFRIGKN